jgi:hypothetical protein
MQQQLIHPAVMAFLFFGTVYAGYLGYQWKRTRELGEEIRALKAALPAAGPDGVRPPSPNEAVISQKETVGSAASTCAWNIERVVAVADHLCRRGRVEASILR